MILFGGKNIRQYPHYIFGYGSLVAIESLRVFLGREKMIPGDYQFCRLRDYQRTWNIARENKIDAPGYKYYIEADSEVRPDIYVTFLNVRPDPGTSIAGLLFGVTAAELKLVDQRERNYQRVEVRNHLDLKLTNPVWLYIGLPEAEQRFQRGQQTNTAVISKVYYELVHDAFLAQGPDAAADYLATTDDPKVPLKRLRVIRT